MSILGELNRANADLARHRYERGAGFQYQQLQTRHDDLLNAHLHQSGLSHPDQEYLHDEISDFVAPYTSRRNAEQELAEYMGRAASYAAIELNDFDLSDRLNRQATKHMECRTTGRVLQDEPGAPLVIAWDNKCGHSRFCPDESRAETQRLKDYYHRHILNYFNGSAFNRVFFSVYTIHNFEPGQLAHGKKYLMNRYRAWAKSLPFYAQDAARKNAHSKNDKTTYAGAFCPVSWVYGELKKTRKKDIVMPPDPIRLQGDLVIQEDPLSALGDWNVHLNVFLMIRGRFDYELARSLWGMNVAWYEQTPDGEGKHSLEKSILEAMKYAAQIVPEKSAEHADAGSRAPSMVEWSFPLFLEWYQGQTNFRRVRATGCLYKVHQKEWDAEDTAGRKLLCAWAGVDDYHALQWDEILQPAGPVSLDEKAMLEKSRNKVKAKLRRAMIHGEPEKDPDGSQCVGAVVFENGAYKSVGSILGDNFSGNSARRVNDNFDFYNFRGSG